MKVYGHPMSTCTRLVLTTLTEKQQPFEFVLVDIMAGHGRSPDHLARQPWGQVPVFEADDGWQMLESRAIIRYLDATLPGISLTPTDARTRATMDQWISIEQSNFTPGVMKILGQLFFARMRGEEPQMSIVEDGRATIRRTVAVLDNHLASRPYIAGADISLADLCFMPYVDYLYAVGEGALIEDVANVKAWWHRLRERPAWQAVTAAPKAAS